VFVVAIPMIENELQTVGFVDNPNSVNTEDLPSHWKERVLKLPLINLYPFVSLLNTSEEKKLRID
jgi:hypothetical protein